MAYPKQTYKKYKCSKCNHVEQIKTNHYGKCWSLLRYNCCKKCPPSISGKYSGHTIWVCLETPTK